MASRKSRKGLLIIAFGGFFSVGFSIFILPYFLGASYEVKDAIAEPLSVAPAELITHIQTPLAVKAIYMSSCVAATPSWRSDLAKFVDETELNAVVIDIKDSTGTVSIIHSDFSSTGKGCQVKDLKEFIEELHKKQIYVIGRLTVFQDPLYAKAHPELAVQSARGGIWKDRKGLSFIDVGAKPYWEDVVSLSKISYELGFDEINFDYVRYPSDGDMDDARYSWTVGTSTKAEMLEGFFSYLHKSLEGTGMKTSVDLFGMTTAVTHDMKIGQVLERALPYFDYIAPMVYPSHYGKGWEGFQSPAEHPYEIVKLSMEKALEREESWKLSQGIATSTPSKLRPWLQDFDIGAEYGTAEVRAQIKATYDAGLNSWMLWDAGNKYTREALLTEE